MFGVTFAKRRRMSIKSLNHQHVSTSSYNPMPQKVSPQSSSEATALIVLHIHGSRGLEEPLDHPVVAVFGCQKQRGGASGAAARGQAAGRTRQNEGDKAFRIFWARQKSKSWKYWPWFWAVLRSSSCLWYSIEALSDMSAVKMSWRNSNILHPWKNNPIVAETSHNLKTFHWTCFLAPGISWQRPNIAKLTVKWKKIWELHKWSRHIRMGTPETKGTIFALSWSCQSIAKLIFNRKESNTDIFQVHLDRINPEIVPSASKRLFQVPYGSSLFFLQGARKNMEKSETLKPLTISLYFGASNLEFWETWEQSWSGKFQPVVHQDSRMNMVRIVLA